MTGAGDARLHVLPVLAGVLLALSFPPSPAPLAVFVALVPLLLFIADLPAGDRGRWLATRGGLITGVVYFGAQLYWMAVALLRYSMLAIPAYLGAVLVLAGLTGAFAWAVHLTRERLRVPLPVLAALYWTSLEWIQAHLGDLAFPWLGLGTALAPLPTLAGAADLVGARGLTLWIAAVNGLIASLVLRYRAGRPLAPCLAALLAVIAVPAAYGVARTTSIQMRPAARVAVVQPDIPEHVKLGPRGLEASLAALTRLTLSLDGTPLDLVAWPEVALPADFLGSDSLRAAARDLSTRIGAPILVGAYGVDQRGGRSASHNSAFLVQPGGGPPSPPAGAAPSGAAPVPDRYDKRKLVPFVERLPFGGAGLLRGAGRDQPPGRLRLGALERGDAQPVLRARNGSRFGVLICYESIFAQLGRSYRTNGADLLVNITNDAWYGFDSPLGRTTALWQHPAHLVLRAIETRAGVARAANTGISMFVDPRGRTYGHTPLFEAATATSTVYTTDASTLFVRWGDWLAGLATLAAALSLLLAYREEEPRGVTSQESRVRRQESRVRSTT